jgi:alkanesulfonate monooxygenase
LAVIARPTRAAAITAAQKLLARAGASSRVVHKSFRARSHSTAFSAAFDQALSCEWLSPTLWTGAVPFLGPSATALLGSYDEIAQALLAYKQDGISEFLFLGWPDLDEMQRFANEVVPRVREQEAAL